MVKLRVLRAPSLLLALLVVAAVCMGCGGKEEAEDAYPGLLMAPVLVEMPADQMEDEALLELFAGDLFPKALATWEFMNGKGLEKDEETVLEGMPEGTNYVLVENIESMDMLRENYRAFFSERFCDVMVYPMFLEGERALFVEHDGRLYINTQISGGFGNAFEMERAVLTEKTADSFTLEVPLAMGDTERWILFGVDANDGLWVIETMRTL